jgi:hypothetical protein
MAVKLLDAKAGVIGGTYFGGPTIIPDSNQRSFFCWGTFGEATVYIEYSPDGNEWFRAKTEESTFSEKDVRTLSIAAGVWVRGAITRATATTLLHLWMW